MNAYIAQRTMQMVPVLLGISLIVFVLLRATGDPVRLMLPDDATQAQVEQLREHLGLNQPLIVQYGLFLRNMAVGDFGVSTRYNNQPALPIVLERLPATALLGGAALLVALAISIPAGVLAATYHSRWQDYSTTTMAILGQAMPNFWLGLMLILLFSVHLQWLPVSGRGTWAHLVLPALTLGTALAAMLTRLLRSGLLEVLRQDYIRTARAKGVVERVVLMKHGMRNALLAYVTVLGLQVSNLLAGAVVTEQVFAYPGIGLLAIQAINARDMALVQAIVIVASLIVMVVNLLVDVLYGLIDPRIRYA